ncbi:unnamed protein product [Adineta steineri]|uniref:Uncharacterized protein n=1 Tax=Adineta steineri TaxID=433720 RepID=A0A815ERN6_9BILA|nr:unnamed protein product [Adineta steineri]CAF1259723.1 unnamed protein product [Adineta steineri]CAF1315723.1 unnamed protein product [Adineta steineri]
MRRRERALTTELRLNMDSDDKLPGISPIFTHRMLNLSPLLNIRSNNYFRISTAPSTTVDRLGLFDPLSNVSTASMIESPSSHRTVFTGNQTTIPYTKPINEYTWCYESSSPSIQSNTKNSSDECLPQLEIDDKPLIYRQQFESSEHFNWYGTSESQGHVIISYKHSIDQNKQRSIMSIVRTRQRTLIESIFDIHSSSTANDILRRICEQCAITDIEYFDPVLCDGVS